MKWLFSATTPLEVGKRSLQPPRWLGARGNERIIREVGAFESKHGREESYSGCYRGGGGVKNERRKKSGGEDLFGKGDW